MIQINLVPDVKQEMIRAQRMRNITISVSIMVGLAAGAVVLVLSLVLGSQAIYEAAVSQRITNEYQTLSTTKDINTALTIQNQLGRISELNTKKSVDSRLLDVIAAINPAAPNDVKLSKITLDPRERTLTLEGSASGGYPATEVFRKTILNTQIVSRSATDTQAAPTEHPLTDNVLLQDTSYGQDANGQQVVRFTVIFTYPEGLLDNTLIDVRVKTPDARVDVTDSKSRVPDSMFSAAPEEIKEEN